MSEMTLINKLEVSLNNGMYQLLTFIIQFIAGCHKPGFTIKLFLR